MRYLNEKNPDYPGKIIGRNMDAKGASGEISQRNEEYDRKLEERKFLLHTGRELGYLAEEIAK